MDWHEGGVLSAKREYLRVTRQKLAFDLCAAPFGTGFFFSWWVGEKRPPRWLCWAILLGTLVAYYAVHSGIVNILMQLGRHGQHIRGPYFLIRLLITLVTLIVVWYVYRAATKALDMDADDPILAVPLLGPLYERFFRPLTYYRIDTMLMFQSAMHSAVTEVIDGLTTAKGLRALTDEEKKPIMRDFLRG